MKIDFSKQQGKKKGAFEVYRAKGDRRSNWCAWYVDSTEKAREMVAYWRKAEPRGYPLADEWVVVHKGADVDRFTTREAVSA